MRCIGGFEIKREEKYFVFASMSRKERVPTEKMAPLMRTSAHVNIKPTLIRNPGRLIGKRYQGHRIWGEVYQDDDYSGCNSVLFS